MTRRMLQLSGVSLALLGLVLLGTTARSAPTEVVTVAGYGLIDTPAEAVAFTGNDLIFEARVTERSNARAVSVTAGGGPAIEYNYTPVSVVVTRVWRGDIKPGDQLVVRALGGRVGDTEYVFEGTADAESYKPGSSMILFTEANIDVDGIAAVTPNFVYVLENGVARSAVYPDERMGADALYSLLAVASD